MNGAVFLCSPVRTPIGRYGGSLSGVRADDLAAHVIKAVLNRQIRIEPPQIDEVVFGCANQAGEDNRNVARMASLLAGLPPSVPGVTINRLCASGLDAVIAGARAIAVGDAELVIAGGVESMSRAPFVMPKAATAFSRTMSIEDTTIGWRFVNPAMASAYGVDSMPETAENVAAEFAVSRADQDAFALRSQQRYQHALVSGWYRDEIVPLNVKAAREILTVDRDEQPRPGTSAEALASLPTPFRKQGTVTAGNAAGVNDGAAALLLASERAVERYGLDPLARMVCAKAAGVLPKIMGMGPVPSVRSVLERRGLSIKDLSVIELNEAFAAQALAVQRELGLADDSDLVNACGGAIALGHPLGMSGARIAGAAARRLNANAGQYGIATMCVGVGQGVTLLLSRV
jgi:3-oxoadipyl-CoA thiolase